MGSFLSLEKFATDWPNSILIFRRIISSDVITKKNVVFLLPLLKIICHFLLEKFAADWEFCLIFGQLQYMFMWTSWRQDSIYQSHPKFGKSVHKDDTYIGWWKGNYCNYFQLKVVKFWKSVHKSKVLNFTNPSGDLNFKT